MDHLHKTFIFLTSGINSTLKMVHITESLLQYLIKPLKYTSTAIRTDRRVDQLSEITEKQKDLKKDKQQE